MITINLTQMEDMLMRAKTFRDLSVKKMIVLIEQDCATVDLPELGMRKIDHHCRRANKLANIYRQGRRNYMYSK